MLRHVFALNSHEQQERCLQTQMSLASACALPAVSRAAVQGASNPKLLGRAAERGRSNAQARLQLPSCYRSIEYISVDLSQQTPDWLEGGGSGGAGLLMA